MINPVFLRTFLELARHKSFTATARALNMTQPGVSQHLAWLEAHFGAALALREGRSFELTEAGEKVIAYGERLFADHERLRESLLDDDPTRGVCRLASPGSFGMKMYTFLVELNAEHPHLMIHFTFGPNASILRDLQADTLDLGFVTQLPTERDDLVIKEIDRERLCLLVPAGFQGRTLRAYEELGFIGHPDGALYASRLLRHMFPGDFEAMDRIPQRGFVNSLVRIPDQVAKGRGFTALPEYACREYADRKSVRIVSPRGMPEDKVYAVARRRKPLARRFGLILDEYARQR